MRLCGDLARVSRETSTVESTSSAWGVAIVPRGTTLARRVWGGVWLVLTLNARIIQPLFDEGSAALHGLSSRI
jgi:hypothetical protein